MCIETMKMSMNKHYMQLKVKRCLNIHNAKIEHFPWMAKELNT